MALAAKARLCNNKSERRPHYLILSNKKSLSFKRSFFKVRAERLELSHLAALDPKSSVSTNSTTPALFFAIANIDNNYNFQIKFQEKILYCKNSNF